MTDLKRIRVAIVTNIPAPYRLPVYEHLSAERDIDLKLFYCSGKEPDRTWDLADTAVPSHYLRENFVTVSGRFIHINPDIWLAFKSFKPELVITSGFNPTHLMAIAYAWLHGAQHVAMTDGTLQSEKTLNAIHRTIRRLVFAGTQAFVGASEGSFDLYKSYGIAPERMFKSHLCANNPAFLDQAPPSSRFDLIFCGRFAAVKNPLFALEVACQTAIRLGRKVSIVFVGSGELDKSIQHRALTMQDHVEAHFPGFATQAELPQRYASARVFLFPTSWDPWGVVANEACAAGLPVIVTPEAGVAGELIVHDKNGFVLPLELQTWVDAATALLQDDALYRRMSVASCNAVADYTYANAAKGLAQAARFAMGQTDQPFVATLRPRVKPPVVVIVQRRLTNYRVPLFEQLRLRLEASGIELRLIYGDPTPDERSKRDEGFIDWAEHVPCRYFLRGQICWQNFREQIQGADLVVVTQENKLVLNHPLVLTKRRFKLAFWGHGANLQSDSPNGFKERFKRWTSARVDWWFPYTEMSANLVTAVGFPANRITVVNNAVDTAKLHQQRKSITPEEARALRESLGFQAGPVGVYVGSLYTCKRLDFLLAAAEAIRRQVPDFHLLILGEGPDRDKVQAWCSAHPWACWVGARFGKEKAAYMSIANVMLNPGMVGLSILDSFVFSVPMLTTACGIHSPEISYLQNGINGLMTSDDMPTYVSACVNLLLNAEALNTLRAGCSASAAEYTVENMASRFADGVTRCLAASRVQWPR